MPSRTDWLTDWLIDLQLQSNSDSELGWAEKPGYHIGIPYTKYKKNVQKVQK
jgi:hypothetical protein